VFHPPPKDCSDFFAMVPTTPSLLILILSWNSEARQSRLHLWE
jgi:hypothetical protein